MRTHDFVYNLAMTKPHKQKYKTTNWSEYNQALVNRGNLFIWFDSKMQWQADKTGKRGRPQYYSDAAIQFCFMIKVLFQLPLRQVSGFIKSLLIMAKLDWETPNFSTLSRRESTIEPILNNRPKSGAIHLLVDSTGMKMMGEGEWKCKKHGRSKHRQWRKLHIGIDAQTGQICAVTLTENNKSDSQILPELLKQLPNDIALEAVYGDGAYDTKACRSAIASKDADAIIPPRKNAQDWKPLTTHAIDRNNLLSLVKKVGRTIWKKWSGYHLRSLVETKMFCIKRLGEKLMAKNFKSQQNEMLIRVAVLNRFIELGMPVTQVAP